MIIDVTLTSKFTELVKRNSWYMYTSHVCNAAKLHNLWEWWSWSCLSRPVDIFMGVCTFYQIRLALVTKMQAGTVLRHIAWCTLLDYSQPFACSMVLVSLDDKPPLGSLPLTYSTACQGLNTLPTSPPVGYLSCDGKCRNLKKVHSSKAWLRKISTKSKIAVRYYMSNTYLHLNIRYRCYKCIPVVFRHWWR